ncbi:MAG: phospholipid carrier-dependent glycosyltransferase [Patescibacteria group bacterium]|nr:phospholipid carrier-dependent glycosyltransferase [Patescibacteria group bacterium]
MFFKKNRFLFILIFILAIFLRFNNLNWDNYHHLHPDERFLTMVMGAMSWPRTLKEYFNPVLSRINPFNIGYKFFVYGSFPLILVKSLAMNLNMDNYNQITILGRALSAFFDLLIVFLVYKTALLLFFKKKTNIKYQIPKIALWSALFYAISVYPIQSSHFFTTDTFLNFFMFGSFYLVLKFYIFGSFFWFFLSAVFFGVALACKISALYILPLNLGAIFLRELSVNKKNKNINLTNLFLRFTFNVLRYTIIFYFSLRLTNPYYFASSNFFDFRLDQRFVSSIESLKYFTKKDAWYPPGVQWINKPWWALLSTTFFAGLGPVNFIIMTVGMFWLLKNLKFKIKNLKLQLKIKNEQIILLLILFWVLGYFVYQSFQFVKSIRYTIYLYPFYAILGGIGLAIVSSQLNRLNQLNQLNRLNWWNWFKADSKFLIYVIRYTLYVIILIWPLLFSTIYLHKNTRVEASEWIYKKLPDKSVILGEHWDDPLPLYVSNPLNKTFQVELLPIFDSDTEEKWQKIKELLEKADYYVLSSNRGWGSIPTVPERYPVMSKFYKNLFEEKCFSIRDFCDEKNYRPELVSGSYSLEKFCFRKIKEFLPYYYQFIRYPDSWIEETFTVYDHQTVYIYERIKK